MRSGHGFPDNSSSAASKQPKVIDGRQMQASAPHEPQQRRFMGTPVNGHAPPTSTHFSGRLQSINPAPCSIGGVPRRRPFSICEAAPHPATIFRAH